MKLIKLLSVTLLAILNMQCSSTQAMLDKKIESNTSFKMEKVSYQYWVAGVKGGGSGINMRFAMVSNPKNVVLDSVYFRGLKGKITTEKGALFARLKTPGNQQNDLIMSNDKQAEFANKLPENNTFPFTLKDNECVISYQEEGKTKYVKMVGLIEIPKEQYPSVRPSN